MPVVIVFSTLGFAIVVAHTLEVTTLRGRGLFFSSFFLFFPHPLAFRSSLSLVGSRGMAGCQACRCIAAGWTLLGEFVGVCQKILFGFDVPQTFVACTDLG